MKDSCGHINISENLEKKIRFLCNKYPSQEWSGILYYRIVSGDFLKKSLQIEAVDFLLNDVGSSTFTDYDITGDVGQYMVKHKLLDCKIGICHSHNVMGTFFSGTDNNTLLEQGEDTVYFLSLIVNNAGVYNAKITIKSTIDCELRYNEKTANTNGKNYNKKWLDKTKQVIVKSAPLTVNRPDLFGEQAEILNRIKNIETNKQKRKEQTQVNYALSREVFNHDDYPIYRPNPTPVNNFEEDKPFVLTGIALFSSVFSLSFDLSATFKVSDTYYINKLQATHKLLGDTGFEMMFSTWLACIAEFIEFNTANTSEAAKLITSLFDSWDKLSHNLNEGSSLVKIINNCMNEVFEDYFDEMYSLEKEDKKE